MPESLRRLPPLTQIEHQAAKLVKQGRTGCSPHLADLGLLPRGRVRANHEALRRIAKRSGLYRRDQWIGPLANLIFQDERV